MNSRIKTIKVRARGFRNHERLKNAIYFYLGGLNLYPWYSRTAPPAEFHRVLCSVHPKIADFRELATGAGQISCHIGRKMDWSGEILPVLRADFGGIGVHLCLIRRNRTYL